MTTSKSQEMLEKRTRLARWIPRETKESVTAGANHLAVYCKDLEETARFYTEIMGMPVINVMDNRDVPESTHMNVDIGGGMALSFFDFPNIPSLMEFATEGVGNLMHVALAITPARFAEVKDRLDANGVEYEEVGGSIYVRDPNRLNLELLLME